jgi:hypothetical protein
MKGTAFFFIILASALLVFGVRMGLASDSTVERSLKTQGPQGQTVSGSQMLLADRIDTDNEIVLGTDQRFLQTLTDQEKTEKENERRSWQMLQNMNLYQPTKKPQNSQQQSGTSTQQ